MKIEKFITKENLYKIVWNGSSHRKTKEPIYHAYYSSDRLTKFGGLTNEKISGNSRFCDIRKGIKDKNGEYLSIDKIHNDGINHPTTCKSCLKLYNRIKNKLEK